MAYAYTFRDLLMNTKFIVPLAIVIGLLIYAFVYPMTFTINPGRWYYAPRGLPPSPKYPFGTTATGQDVFLIVPVALRNTLIISFVAAALGIVIALTLGSVAALTRNQIVRGIVSTFIDVMCMLPSLPILMVVLYAWRDYLALPSIGAIMSTLGWTFTGRAIRGFLESLKNRLFIYTSYLSGLSLGKVILKDVVPYLLRYMMVSFVSMMVWAIGNEVTISVFGAMKMEEVTIGTTIHWALHYNAIFLGQWWWIAFPILFLAIFMLSLYTVIMEVDTYLFARAKI